MDIGVSSYWVSLIPIAVIVLIIVLVVAFTRRGLADGASLLTPRRLVEGYVFCVVLVSMILVSLGAGDILRAGFAHRYGLAFSYQEQPIWNENQKPGEQPKYEYDANAPRRDFLGGSAQLAVGILIGLLHLVGLRRLSRSEALSLSPVYRIFLIVGLVIYTCAVLIHAVGSVQDILIYRYGGASPAARWYNRPIPGDKLAGLVGYLPLWGLLVGLLFRYAGPRVKATRTEAV